MRLKRLELRGFKSFAEATAVEFGRGITGVVGPNGSGKSNLVEAIRWVLGEPSARSLRGGRMEDVIYAGGPSRRPLPLAEVSLTVEDDGGLLPAGFSEVTVTRRVDRAGQSEFFLNRAPCRLRDVQECFAGTGLSRHAFAVVGQGQVESVLALRPEERRALVEEAAGVTRFRARRVESDRRLAVAAEASVRLRDLLAERLRALGPLARQSERAERHHALAVELRSLDLSLWAGEAEVLAARLAAARSAAEAGRDALEAALADLEQAAVSQRDAAARLAAVQGSQRAAADGRRAIEARRGDVRHAAALAGGLARGLLAEEGRLLARRGELEQRLAEHDGEVAAAAQRRSGAVSAQADTARQLEAAEGEAAAAEAGRSSARSRLAELRERRAAAGAAALAGQALAAAQRDWQAAEEGARREGDTAREGRASAREAAERAAASEVGLEALRQRVAVARSARDEAADRLRSAQGRAAALREAEAMAAGYGEGPRAVLAGKASGAAAFRGIVGSLAQLVEVPEPYEVAIAAALGGVAQHLVAESFEAAQAAIAELRERRAGHATFLPLGALAPASLSSSLRGLSQREGAVGWALDLIGCAAAVRPAVEHALGRTLVARDLDAARHLARESGFRVRIATLDGEVVHVGGAVSGGSAPRGPRAGLLGRRGEARRFRDRVSALDRELASADADLAEAARLLAAEEAEASDRRRSASEAEAAATAAEAVAGRAAEEAERTRRRFEGARVALGPAAQADDEQALGEAVARAESEAAEGESRASRAAEAVSVLRLRLAAERQEAQAAAAWTERLVSQRAAMEREVAEADGRLDQLRRERAEREAEAAGREAEEQEIGRRLAECAAGEEELAGDEARARAQVAAADGRRAVADAARLRAEEVLRRAEVDEARQEAARSALEARLADAYGLQPGDLVGHRPPERPAAARERAAALRGQLAELGAVDAGAVEAYAREREASTQLSGQVEDLDRVRARVAGWAEAMEARLEARYLDVLEAVRLRFREVCGELFGGGDADLVSASAEEGSGGEPRRGLDVVVRLPGKRPGSLMLLSGGERSLVAVALLFALMEVRPPGFCVLDEVEASLDDANVRRLCRYLARAEGRTQMVVITHQKGTMEVASRLVGVTLGRDGVSELVSVRLAG